MTIQDDDRRQALVELEGPWRFQILRVKPGNQNPSVVADGCMFDDGACVLRWRGDHKSTAAYASYDDLKAVHGHDGTVFVWLDETRTKAFSHGASHCLQDACENAPFGSIGGLAARETPVARFAEKGTEAEYLRGYIAGARAMYGADWRTCEFGWSKAVEIP